MAKDKIAEFLTKTECKNTRMCKTYCTARQWMFNYILSVESTKNLAKKWANVLKKVYEKVTSLLTQNIIILNFKY